ncbi:helix-turn-helix transcriptional regulator [Streptomyces griseoviridis]|uniref:helix-turn-helix domain-containing protein n=1 Tax=Streptomyces griseoviridis TaxID=45398 RepID=UPI003411AE08
MSTDYQRAREELGRRLRELRHESPRGRLTGPELARRLGWPQSKISKLENGRQTPSDGDLRAWAEATGQPQVFGELSARLKGFESHIRSWRRQLASGHRAAQENYTTLVSGTRTIRAWQTGVVHGMLQTPDYARALFESRANLRNTPKDADDAVRARMKRQEWLYRPGKELHVLMLESALRVRVCSAEVQAAQLDRLLGAVGMDTVRLGVVPLDIETELTPGHAFSILDERLVTVEAWHAGLILDDAESVALYGRIWTMLARGAVYGPDAQRVIARARSGLHR